MWIQQLETLLIFILTESFMCDGFVKTENMCRSERLSKQKLVLNFVCQVIDSKRLDIALGNLLGIFHEF